MTPFSLNAALGAPVDAVARMLADKAEVIRRILPARCCAIPVNQSGPARLHPPEGGRRPRDCRSPEQTGRLRSAVHGRQTSRQALLGSR